MSCTKPFTVEITDQNYKGTEANNTCLNKWVDGGLQGVLGNFRPTLKRGTDGNFYCYPYTTASVSTDDLVSCCTKGVSASAQDSAICKSSGYCLGSPACVAYMSEYISNELKSGNKAQAFDMANTFLTNLGNNGNTELADIAAGNIFDNFTEGKTWENYYNQSSSEDTTSDLINLSALCNKGSGGGCQVGIQNFCKGIKRGNITDTSTYPNNVRLALLCGCFMDCEPGDCPNYPYNSIPGSGSQACDPICVTSANVKNKNLSCGGQCGESACIIDDVTIDINKSLIGSGVNIDNVCSSCGSGSTDAAIRRVSNTEDGSNCNATTCNCYIGNVKVDINDSILGGIDLTQKCGGGCWKINKNTDGSVSVGEKVPCSAYGTSGGNGGNGGNGGDKGTPISKAVNTFKDDIEKYFADNGAKSIAIAGIIILAILIITVYFLRTPSSSRG